MVEKNNEYILDIVGVGYEGEGIAKIDGYPIFIEGAIYGEKVRVLIIKVKKNFAYGKLLEVLEASKDRIEPKCENYKRCGGCSVQH
ncbi:TRAM domain-containing protein, partial [Clostridium perfringens]